MINPVRPVIPVVTLVISPRPLLQMLGVDTQPVMTAVANDLIVAEHLRVECAKDEAIGRELLPVEPNLPHGGSIRHDTPCEVFFLFCQLSSMKCSKIYGSP